MDLGVTYRISAWCKGDRLHVMVGYNLWEVKFDKTWEPKKKMWRLQKCSPLTCLPSGVMRLRLLVEMFKLMDIPANCRLLFPRMLDRVLDGGWKDQSIRYHPRVSKKAVKNWALKSLLFRVLMKQGGERLDKISWTHSDVSVWSWCHIGHGGKTTLSYILDVLWQRC